MHKLAAPVQKPPQGPPVSPVLEGQGNLHNREAVVQGPHGQTNFDSKTTGEPSQALHHFPTDGALTGQGAGYLSTGQKADAPDGY